MEQTLVMALCEIIMTHHPSTCKRALRFQPPPRSPSGHSSHGSQTSMYIFETFAPSFSIVVGPSELPCDGMMPSSSSAIESCRTGFLRIVIAAR